LLDYVVQLLMHLLLVITLLLQVKLPLIFEVGGELLNFLFVSLFLIILRLKHVFFHLYRATKVLPRDLNFLFSAVLI
jgi:hypothetical protein